MGRGLAHPGFVRALPRPHLVCTPTSSAQCGVPRSGDDGARARPWDVHLFDRSRSGRRTRSGSLVRPAASSCKARLVWHRADRGNDAQVPHMVLVEGVEMPARQANVKNKKQYEALKEKGMSKERAAKIANSPGASKRGGKRSGSGGNAKQGGTTAQHKAAGRKGGKAAARKRS